MIDLSVARNSEGKNKHMHPSKGVGKQLGTYCLYNYFIILRMKVTSSICFFFIILAACGETLRHTSFPFPCERISVAFDQIY